MIQAATSGTTKTESEKRALVLQSTANWLDQLLDNWTTLSDQPTASLDDRSATVVDEELRPKTPAKSTKEESHIQAEQDVADARLTIEKLEARLKSAETELKHRKQQAEKSFLAQTGSASTPRSYKKSTGAGGQSQREDGETLGRPDVSGVDQSAGDRTTRADKEYRMEQKPSREKTESYEGLSSGVPTVTSPVQEEYIYEKKAPKVASPDQDEYYYEKKIREWTSPDEDEHFYRKTVNQPKSFRRPHCESDDSQEEPVYVKAAKEPKSPRDPDYESDDSMIYVRKEVKESEYKDKEKKKNSLRSIAAPILQGLTEGLLKFAVEEDVKARAAKVEDSVTKVPGFYLHDKRRQVNALESSLDNYRSGCYQFADHPLDDRKGICSEHHTLTEGIMQIVAKADEIDDDDPDIRAARKALINRANEWMQYADDVKTAALSQLQLEDTSKNNPSATRSVRKPRRKGAH